MCKLCMTTRHRRYCWASVIFYVTNNIEKTKQTNSPRCSVPFPIHVENTCPNLQQKRPPLALELMYDYVNNIIVQLIVFCFVCSDNGALNFGGEAP